MTTNEKTVVAELTDSVTRQVADLARIELTSDEVTLYSQQLQQFLTYVNQIMEVNVQGIEPLTHPLEVELVLRDDHVETDGTYDGQPKILASAPEVVNGGFKVPPVL